MAYVLEDSVHTSLSANVAVGASSIDVNKSSSPFNDVPDPSGNTSPLTLTDSTVSPSKIEIITYTGRTDNGDGTYTLGGVTKNAHGSHGDQSWSSGDVALQGPLVTPDQWGGKTIGDLAQYEDLDGGGTPGLLFPNPVQQAVANEVDLTPQENAGDPNGAVAARYLYDECIDTSASPVVRYIATAVDDPITVGGTTWTSVVDLLSGTDSDQVPTNDDIDSRGFAEAVDSVADLRAGSFPANLDRIWLSGYYGVGTPGGGPLYRDSGDTTTTDNGVTVFVDADGVRWKRPNQLPILGSFFPEHSGENFSDWIKTVESEDVEHYLRLRSATYVADAAKTITDFPLKLEGSGAFELQDGTNKGSIIDASADSPSHILKIAASASSQQRSILRDHTLIHTGTDAAYVLSSQIRTYLADLKVDCQTSGAIGVRQEGSGSFNRYERLHLHSWTVAGLKIDQSAGAADVVRDCHILSGVDGATAAIHVLDAACPRIEGGQANLNKSTDDGIAVLLENNTADMIDSGGIIDGLICERDIGIKVTGTQRFRFLYFWNLQFATTTTGVIFDQAIDCFLMYPQFKSFSGTQVEWTANAIRCGAVLDSFTAQAISYTVASGATDCWVKVEGHVELSDLSNIATDPNLTVIADHVEELGRVVHNGTAWTVQEAVIADDAAASFSSPFTSGFASFASTRVGGPGGGEYAKVPIDPNVAIPSSIFTGSNTSVDASDGPLSGTTGADGVVTVKYGTASQSLYVENRTGTSLTARVKFSTLAE